jgi:hypothetical protein
MTMLKELLALKESRSKEYLENLIDKAINVIKTKGMSYEDAVDAIADKAKELASPDEQIVDRDLLIDMIKAVYDDELNEGKPEYEIERFDDMASWEKAAKKLRYDIESWGHGSKSAHNDYGKNSGEWVADFDCNNGDDPHGWLKFEKVSEAYGEPEAGSEEGAPVEPKLLGKAGDYRVTLDDDEQVNLYYEDEMLTTMPLVIWKQLTKI